MDKQMNKQVNEWTNNKWMNEQINEWMNKQINEWTNK